MGLVDHIKLPTTSIEEEIGGPRGESIQDSFYNSGSDTERRIHSNDTCSDNIL